MSANVKVGSMSNEKLEVAVFDNEHVLIDVKDVDESDHVTDPKRRQMKLPPNHDVRDMIGRYRASPAGLSPTFCRDQHVVGGRLDDDGDGEQRCEGGMGRCAPVEAEDELVKVGLEMRSAQAVVDTKPPRLEVGEN